MGKYKKLLLLDFDGVLSEFDGKFEEGIAGKPLPNARKAVFLLLRDYRLKVFTTRDPKLVKGWLAEFGFPSLDVTDVKEPCSIHIDDRAICFEGVWNDQLLNQIKQFTPWWKQPQPTSETASACSEQTGSPSE